MTQIVITLSITLRNMTLSITIRNVTLSITIRNVTLSIEKLSIITLNAECHYVDS
jgi:hypothetical protein